MTDAITDCKPSCNIYGSREWNGIWGAVGVGRGEGGNIKIFSSNLRDLHKSFCRPQGVSGPRTPQASYTAGCNLPLSRYSRSNVQNLGPEFRIWRSRGYRPEKGTRSVRDCNVPSCKISRHVAEYMYLEPE